MSNCRKHGYYLNVNGCPDCSFPKSLALMLALNRIAAKKKKKAA